MGLNGVTSVCRGQSEQYLGMCGRPARSYVRVLGRWFAVCGRHRRIYTRLGYPIRGIS